MSNDFEEARQKLQADVVARVPDAMATLSSHDFWRWSERRRAQALEAIRRGGPAWKEAVTPGRGVKLRPGRLEDVVPHTFQQTGADGWRVWHPLPPCPKPLIEGVTPGRGTLASEVPPAHERILPPAGGLVDIKEYGAYPIGRLASPSLARLKEIQARLADNAKLTAPGPVRFRRYSDEPQPKKPRWPERLRKLIRQFGFSRVPRERKRNPECVPKWRRERSDDPHRPNT